VTATQTNLATHISLWAASFDIIVLQQAPAQSQLLAISSDDAIIGCAR
jgi:hypothetical protein